MSALKFARQAFGEKPHSSVSDWVDILTKADYNEESYDGIPELVDAIDLQGTTGSTEVSRALRKKLKHGNAHQQYRALVILKALVDNCGEKFRKIFQDGNLTDALKNLASDLDADKRVKKKLLLVLLAWDEQYKDDGNMNFVAGVLKHFGSGLSRRSARSSQGSSGGGGGEREREREGSTSNGEDEGKGKKKKVDVLAELSNSEKATPKKGKDKKKPQKEKQQRQPQNTRTPFDFEKDKDKVMQSIIEGFQASSNLVNAITLVNKKTDNLQQNERVQECLEQAKKVKTSIVRYIQLVENEDIIGTLIESNDRLMEAVEMYDRLSVSEVDPDPESTELAKAMAASHLASGEPIEPSPFDNTDDDDDENKKSESKTPHIHPDLEDLTFGPLKSGPGSSSSKLPQPMKPSFQALSDDDDDRDEGQDRRASLSDFSDYVSSDEETHKANANANVQAGPSKRNYVTVSDDDEEEDDQEFTTPPLGPTKGIEDDPFADPFADEHSPRRK